MDKKTFIFELYDRITGPLGKILNDSVDRVAKGFRSGLGAAADAASRFRDRVGDALQSASVRAAGFASRMWDWAGRVRNAFGAKPAIEAPKLPPAVGAPKPRATAAVETPAGGDSALDKLSKVREAAGPYVEAARMLYAATSAAVKVAAGQETTRLSMSARLGAPRAEEVTTRSMAFARQTPFDTQAVTAWYAQLAEQGRSNAEIERILRAGGDLAARSGFDPKVMDQLVGAFSSVDAEGKIDLSALENAGIPPSVLQAVRKGAAGGKATIAAVLDAVKSQVSGGNLGSLMAQGRGSAAGQLTRLQSLPTELFAGLDQQPGFKVFKDFLENLVGVLDPASASGQALRNVFFDFFNGALNLLKPLTGDEGLGRMKGILEMITTVAQGLGLVFQGVFTVVGWLVALAYAQIMLLWSGFEGVGKAIGFVAFKIWEAWQAITAFFAKISEVAASMWQMGQQIVQGLIDGIMSSLAAVGESLRALSGTVVGGLKSLLGIHSPSAVFRELGVSTVAGFAQGLDQGAGGAGAAVAALVDVPSAPRAAAAAVRPNVQITVNATGEGARDIAERVRAATIEALQSAFEQLALEQGVA